MKSLSTAPQLFSARIAGTGSYLPEGRITNSDLEKLVETSDEWIVERTGIRQRCKAAPEQSTSDLALIASQRALESAGLEAKDLDMIIMATVTPDRIMPSCACILQQKLKTARPIMTFDISAACTGFLYALNIAHQFIRTGQCRHILVAGAEVLHRFVNYKDRETCILFGDGAGAMVLSRSEDSTQDIQTQAANKGSSAILSECLHADGQLSDLIFLPAGGSAMPLSSAVLENELHFVRMKGREIFKNAVRAMSQCCEEALTIANVSAEQVDWLIPHQANIRIIEAVAKHFGIALEKVIINIQNTGNNSAATIPIAFDTAVRDGRIKRGQHILLTAFGAGLTSGGMLIRY